MVDKLVDRRKTWQAHVDMRVLRRPKSELTQCEKMVYTAICGFISREGTAFPSASIIAEIASCSERWVFKSLAKLEKVELIIRHAQFRPDGGQKSTLYEFFDFDNYTPPSECNSCPPPEHTSDVTKKQEILTFSSSSSRKMAAPAADAPPAAERRASPATLPFSEIEKETEKLSLTECKSKIASPEPEKEIYGLDETPEIMRQTAAYLLLKTGREKLSGDELDSLIKLDAEHYPAFVQKKIDEICERFTKKGKPLKTLTFCYITAALKNFTPTLRARASPPRFYSDDFAIADLERRREFDEANFC